MWIVDAACWRDFDRRPYRMPRFRLWHSLDARSFRVLWTFEELALWRGRDYALHTMRFPPRQHHPEFLEHNPLGTVPWFEHKEPGEPRPRASMSESCAVALYLAELHSSPLALALRSGDDEYGSFLNWLHHAETITFPQAVVMRYALFERERGLRAAADDYARWFHARLRLLNTALADGRTFLVGASVENKRLDPGRGLCSEPGFLKLDPLCLGCRRRRRLCRRRLVGASVENRLARSLRPSCMALPRPSLSARACLRFLST